MISPICPLCLVGGARDLYVLTKRTFFECPNCDLLFAVPDCTLSLEAEKQRYDFHNNNASDDKYVSHLRRLKLLLAPKLQPGMKGLDFGSGAECVLGGLFEQAGFLMDAYDPFYGPALSAEKSKYDFVACTETAEHFANPRTEFTLINSILKPHGYIGIITNFREGSRRVASWWYLRDQTHRCIFSKKSFEKISEILSWKINVLSEDIGIFQKSPF